MPNANTQALVNEVERLQKEVERLNALVQAVRETSTLNLKLKRIAEREATSCREAWESERKFIQEIEGWVGADCRGSIGTGIKAAIDRLKAKAK